MTTKNQTKNNLSFEDYIQEQRVNEFSLQVIDVRSQHDFEQAPIVLKHCINLPYSTLDTNLRLLDHHKPVYVVCQQGCEDSASTHACSILSKHGFQCTCIEGGFNEINKRLSSSDSNTNMTMKKDQDTLIPFVLENRDSHPSWPLERQARFTSGFLTLSGLLGYSLSRNKLFLLGSSSLAAGAVFSALTDSCGLAKVLKMMPWNKNNYRWL
ncbi:hypothetical protein C9374_010431 [Naegleria lovaniensis]|uniref:Rhodanese domain-containing protein n=1 Tax=Naegleria lovaniensis TaxID=51637 RepID=A0AA88GBP2_NAELO|nr:uncharacterized protein C9374_010431 [Naegleria lovaniensis]KAG2374687.1 hypothetical protein C9374_010431 [Naegleria lovaniensis]